MLAERPKHALGHHEGGIGEPVDEVCALGIGAHHRNEFAVGRRRAAVQQRAQRCGAPGLESKQQVARVIGPAVFECHDRSTTGVVSDEHGNAVDNREGAALTAEHPGDDGAALAHERLVLDRGQARATERAAQQCEQGLVHGTMTQSGSDANESMNVGPHVPTAARRKCSMPRSLAASSGRMAAIGLAAI